MSKKSDKDEKDGVVNLRNVLESSSAKAVKTNITLRVDAALLKEAQATFGRRLGLIFEAALQDAITIKKDNKKSS